MTAVTMNIEVCNGVRVIRMPAPGGGCIVTALDDEGVSVQIMSAGGVCLLTTFASVQEIARGELN